MPRQAINRGTTAGDGTGESLFSAFTKINENETELYAAKTEEINGSATLLPSNGTPGKIYVTRSDGLAYMSLGGSSYQRLSGRYGAKTLPYSNSNDITQRLIDACTNSNGSVIELPVGNSTITGQITTPANVRMLIHGVSVQSGASLSTVTSSVAGYTFKPSNGYELENFLLLGPGNFAAGSVGIGSNDAVSAGSCSIQKMWFSGFELPIDFGTNFEHPLGLDFDKIYIQDFGVGAFNIGGGSAARSGESSWNFGRVVATNNSVTPLVSASTKTANTPTTSYDRVTWNGTAPRYGWLIVRSLNDSTNWQVVPNIKELITDSLTTRSFDCAKNPGETWFYRVIRATVGASVHRGKIVTFANLQCENVAVGALLNNIIGATIGAMYSEIHPESMACGMLASVYNSTSTTSIGTVRAEKAAYGIINRGGRLSYRAIHGNNLTRGLIGLSSIDTAVGAPTKHGLGMQEGSTPAKIVYMDGGATITEYTGAGCDVDAALMGMKSWVDGANGSALIVRKQGVDRITADIDPVSGYSRLTGVQLARFDVPEKALRPLLANTTMFTALTSGIPTAVLKFTLPSNGSAGLLIPFTIQGFDAVHRQVITGLLAVSAVSAFGSIAATATITGLAKAIQGGTLTDPTPDTSVVGQEVTVTISLTTSLTGLMIACNSLSLTGSDATSITQL